MATKKKRPKYFGDYYKDKAFSGKIYGWLSKLDKTKYEYNLKYKYHTEEQLSHLYSSLGLSRYRTFNAFHSELMQWYPELRKFSDINTLLKFNDSYKRRYFEDLQAYKKSHPSYTGADIDNYTEHLLNKYASESSPLYREVYEKAKSRWKLYQAREKLMVSGQYQYYRSENYREQYVKQLEVLGMDKRYIDALKRVSIEKWYEMATTPNNSTTSEGLRLLPALGTFYMPPEILKEDPTYLQETTEKLKQFLKHFNLDPDEDSPIVTLANVSVRVADPEELVYRRSKKSYKRSTGTSFEKYFSYQRLMNAVTDRELRSILKSLPQSLRNKIVTSDKMYRYYTSPEESVRKIVKFKLLEIREKAGNLNIRTSYKGKSYVPFTANSKLLSEYFEWKRKK